MSEHLDSKIINSILRGDDGSVIADKGILLDMFESDARPVFQMLVSHYRQYHKLPAKQEIKKHFRNFRFVVPTEPLDYYVEELTRRYKMAQFRLTVQSALEEVAKTEDKNIDTVLQDSIAKLTMARQCGVTAAEDYVDRGSYIEEELRQRKEMAAEFSFGMEALDHDLIGFDRGNLVLIGGTAGFGKTWVLLQMAYNNWMKRAKKILFISLEMSANIIQQRLDAIMCRFDYNRYRRSQLTNEEERELIFKLKSMKAREVSFKVISFENYDTKAKATLGSVESIQACVQRYKPDMLYVDGIYLGMSMKWEDATKFANDFHSMLENLRVPCTATTQMKQDSDENKPRLQDLAFTAGFQHAASYVFLMGRDKDVADRSQLTMTVAKARESMDHEKYLLNFKPASRIDLTPMTMVEQRDWWEGEDDSEVESVTIDSSRMGPE